MAFIRPRKRADGSTGHTVLHKVNGQQTSLGTFDDEQEAEDFRDTVNSIGAEKAMLAWGIAPTKQSAMRSSSPTVAQWLQQYIASRTGVTKATIYDYSSYLENDIAPQLGAVPIDLLTPDDVASWVNWMAARPSGKFDEDGEPLTLSGKTIANRHGFFSAALNTAVRQGLIPSNPALGTRIPRTPRAEMVCLDADEVELFAGCFTPYWRPLTRFLVASGARIGEVSALWPSDVNRKASTVHVGKSRKRTYDEARYEIGSTKSKRSDRTISVASAVLDELDYSKKWLFTNTVGNQLDKDSYRNNVWYPAVARAQKAGLAKKPRIHDMRHTCASLMINGGASLMAVQRHLGHESISTTVNLYGHLDRKSADEAAAIIGRALGGI
ncbi:integrase [Mycobacterium frederiksbergense]|uniref:Integrase n=1 Tax=Mycolicibacterium frederiksbergense TaxID=117567 RepID=A0ABT6L8H1_9MYCO|nr:tyrosine-type recombinase/integrase [Mycolicibacterium frederiksbergense]MDH6199251.1 integrase [Mycolicibacterium frederiksbergense]